MTRRTRGVTAQLAIAVKEKDLILSADPERHPLAARHRQRDRIGEFAPNQRPIGRPCGNARASGPTPWQRTVWWAHCLVHGAVRHARTCRS